MNDVN